MSLRKGREIERDRSRMFSRGYTVSSKGEGRERGQVSYVLE